MAGASVPISQRLLQCAGFVRPGASVCDVGFDHGYLAIHLALNGAASVLAMDIAAAPLEKAKANIARFGLSERIETRLTDGLAGVGAEECDTVIIAGMGGDCIAGILERCPWAGDGQHRFILQPQTSGNDLRRWLGEQGWRIEAEQLLEDAGRLYTALVAVAGGGRALTPGEQFLSPALRASGSPLLPRYITRLRKAMEAAIEGLSRSTKPEDPPRLRYYQEALTEIVNWEAAHGNES